MERTTETKDAVWCCVYGKRIYDIVKMIGLDLRLSLICRFSHLSLTHHPSPHLTPSCPHRITFTSLWRLLQNRWQRMNTRPIIWYLICLLCVHCAVCCVPLTLYSIHSLRHRVVIVHCCRFEIVVCSMCTTLYSPKNHVCSLLENIFYTVSHRLLVCCFFVSGIATTITFIFGSSPCPASSFSSSFFFRFFVFYSFILFLRLFLSLSVFHFVI